VVDVTPDTVRIRETEFPSCVEAGTAFKEYVPVQQGPIPETISVETTAIVKARTMKAADWATFLCLVEYVPKRIGSVKDETCTVD
jgi:hypothetical protein